MPVCNERLSFRLNLAGSIANLHTVNTYCHEGFEIYYFNDITVNYFALDGSILFRYRLSGKKYVPYLHFGGFADLLSYSRYYRDEQLRNVEDLLVRERTFVTNPFTTFCFGPLLGFSVDGFKAWEHDIVLSLDYTFGLGIKDGIIQNSIRFSASVDLLR